MCMRQVKRLLIKSDHNCSPVEKVEVEKSGACVDQPHNKLLPYMPYSNSSNTPAMCLAACTDTGYRFAGVKYGKECWCGDREPPTSSYTAPAHCDMPCSGDQEQLCGANSVLNLYRTSNLNFISGKFLKMIFQM